MRRGANWQLRRAMKLAKGEAVPRLPPAYPYKWPVCTALDVSEGRHPSLVYVIVTSLDHRIAKIGTTTNLAHRLRALQTGSPARLKVVATREGGRSLEAALHARFADHRQSGEWFHLPAFEGALLLGLLAGHHAAEKILRASA